MVLDEKNQEIQKEYRIIEMISMWVLMSSDQNSNSSILWDLKCRVI